MGTFKDPVNYVAYSLNHTTVTIAGEDNVDGLERVEAEIKEDEVDEEMAADGIGMFVENPSKAGRATIQVLDGTAISNVLWQKAEDGEAFSLSVKDSKTANFVIKGDVCRVVKRPTLMRGARPDKPEWIISCIYMKIKGGTRAVVTA